MWIFTCLDEERLEQARVSVIVAPTRWSLMPHSFAKKQQSIGLEPDSVNHVKAVCLLRVAIIHPRLVTHTELRPLVAKDTGAMLLGAAFGTITQKQDTHPAGPQLAISVM